MPITDDIERLADGNPTRDGIARLLTVEGAEQDRLFQRARQERHRAGGDPVTLRGVIEISNHCQKSCDYCAMRHPNGEMERYRMTPERILEMVAEIAANGIPIAFLQAGQDPVADAMVAELIPEIKRRFDLRILLCLGERPRATYRRFAELGADSYILKFETSSPAHYRSITRTSLAARLACLRHLRELGYAIGTGNIVGLPDQNLSNLVDDVFLALQLRPDFVSASPFIANQSTPFESAPQGSLNTTLNTLAIYRIGLRTPLIPNVSALEKLEVGGQRRGLEAGANVMTVNFTPPAYQERFNIYSKRRFVVGLQHALATIASAGMETRRPAPEARLVGHAL